jgi:hypothetical protein
MSPGGFSTHQLLAYADDLSVLDGSIGYLYDKEIGQKYEAVYTKL